MMGAKSSSSNIGGSTYSSTEVVAATCYMIINKMFAVCVHTKKKKKKGRTLMRSKPSATVSEKHKQNAQNLKK